jgi:hypothetical protein
MDATPLLLLLLLRMLQYLTALSAQSESSVKEGQPKGKHICLAYLTHTLQCHNRGGHDNLDMLLLLLQLPVQLSVLLL